MKINEIMTPECQTCDVNDPVAKAAQLMTQNDYGSTPVSKDDRLIGMVTDRDIVTRGVAEGRDLNNAKVGELMSDNIYYCYDDQDCNDVAQNMGDLQVRRLPVVNRDKKLVGVVSLGDLSTRAPKEGAGAALNEISQPPPQ